MQASRPRATEPKRIWPASPKAVSAGLGVLICTLLVPDRPTFGQNAEGDGPLVGISHIALKISDLGKSLDFYHQFLGFDEHYRLTNTDGTLGMVALKVSDRQWIELFPGLQPEGERLHQLAFQVKEAENLRLKLLAAGFKVPDRVPKGRIQNSNFSVRGPNNITIEFVQYEPWGWTVRDKGKCLAPERISERITHAGITVADLPAVKSFYEDLLAMKQGWRGSRDGKALSYIHVTVPASGDYLEYMLARKQPEGRDPAVHFCLLVPDMAKAKAALDARDYRKSYSRPIEIIVGKNRKRILNLFDPDGVRVELMEPDTVDGKPTPSSTAPWPPPD